MTFEVHRRAPPPHLAGIVAAITGYRETAPGWTRMREAAPLRVPLIISFGAPFRIALGRAPHEADRQPSFAAGLFPGPVEIASDGAAACVQAGFTPLGPARLFGGALADLANRMVPLDLALGTDGARLRERLGATPDWSTRFAIVEAFVTARLTHRPSPEVSFAWHRLAATGGALRITALAEEIGWSRQRLHTRFRAELGQGPKTVARMLRFHHACRAATRANTGWAGIAADCGYADQAHLAREFLDLGGEPPTTWARRVAARDPRLNPLAEAP